LPTTQITQTIQTGKRGMSEKQLVIILKNPGTTCNMGCIYCAEEKKNYTTVGNRIENAQAERLADLTKGYSLNVLFHGGEPTLLPTDYYGKLIDIFEARNNDVYFGVQTNAFSIDEAWISFLKANKHRLGVSVSLDGTKSMNRLRITKNKTDTYERVLQNIKNMAVNGIKTGMICTIVSTSLGKEKELLDLLMSLENLLFVKLNPCFDRDEAGQAPQWAVTPKQYAEFVKNVFSIMLKNGNWNRFYIEPIMSVLKNLQGISASFCNYSFKKCENFISLYPDGTITSCDNYNLQQGFLGNLIEISRLDEILDMRNNIKLCENYKLLMAECCTCEYVDICKGGCIAVRNRYRDTNEYCVEMKSMINYDKKAYEALK
jgi:uncharacterized protein